MTTKFSRQLLLSGYTKDQIHEIEEGLLEGLDVDFYANKSYLAIQMHQIRLGLKEGLMVEYYAKPYFDWMQMEEIRKGLRDGLAVERYAFPSLPHDKMKQLRKGLKAGIDLFAYQHLSAGILRELRKSLLSGITLLTYIQDGYDAEQLRAIRHALEKGIDLSPYLDLSYRDSSIQEIYLGLEHGLDVSLYADPHFTWRKMREIRLGMEHRLDVSLYADPLYSYWQMKEIRLGLENHIDVSYYSSLMYTAREMNRIRLQYQMHTSNASTPADLTLHKLDQYNIYISKDQMQVYMELTDLAADINVDTVLQSLNDLGICHGINTTTIRNLVFKTYEKQQVLIAEGTLPTVGTDGWYEYFFNPEQSLVMLPFQDDYTGFQDIPWFELVKEDQIIAIYHSASEGIPGSTVTGTPIPARRGKEKPILTGSGFKLLPDGHTYVAAKDGRIHFKNDQLVISSLLILDQLGSLSEPINFHGSLLINCNIPNGFTIQASDDIVIDGYVESSTIKCGGSILLKKGMHASGTSTITAGKNILGKFFENVTLNAGGNIQSLYFLHCNLSARGTIITLSQKGGIIGGYAYAEKGFYIHNAGNSTGLSTVIRMGVDEYLKEKSRLLNEKKREASKQLNILLNTHMEFQHKYSPALRNAMETYLKIEDAIYTKRLQLEKLEQNQKALDQRISAADDAKAIIEYTLYDNVILEISGLTKHSKYVEHVTISKDFDTITITERMLNYA